MANATNATNATSSKASKANSKASKASKANATPATNDGSAVAVATPVVATPPVAVTPRTVAATAKAAAGVAAGVAKRGSHQLTPNQTATLAAMRSAGAVDAVAAISHNQIAAITGRVKGNQLRQLSAAGLVVQLAVPGTLGYRFYLT